MRELLPTRDTPIFLLLVNPFLSILPSFLFPCSTSQFIPFRTLFSIEYLRLLENFWTKGAIEKAFALSLGKILHLTILRGLFLLEILIFSKISLMAKNVFSYLIGHKVIWVDIMYHKYGEINFCVDSIPLECSWVFR